MSGAPSSKGTSKTVDLRAYTPDIPGVDLARVIPEFGSGNSWDLLEPVKRIGLAIDDKKTIVTIPVVLTALRALAAGQGGSTSGKLQCVDIVAPNGDGITAGFAGIGVTSAQLLFNGTNMDRLRTPTVQTSVSGASPLTILPAGGVGVKNRIFAILIGSNNAGAVVINDISGGLTTQVAAGASNAIPFPQNGIVQTTANTAITATLAAATLTAVVLSGPS